MEGKEIEAGENPARKKDPAASGGAQDQELEALLNASLEQFGKNVPAMPKKQAEDAFSGANLDSVAMGGKGSTDPKLTKEGQLEDMFGEQLAAQAEAQLNEAIQTLRKDNPDLMKQFESFAKSFAMEDMPLEIDEPGPSSSVDPPSSQSSRGAEAAPMSKSSLDAALEDTVRNLQQSTEKLQGDGLPPQFLEMLNMLQVQGDKEDAGEEGLMKMMEGMMSTLLSKEVLYPSLQDLVSQYPEWLRQHDGSLDPQDKQRYQRQLELMKKICLEFESEEAESGEKKASSQQKERQQRILSLMQELQEFGQPPEDLAGASLGQPGFPVPPGPDKCPVM